MKIKDFKFNRGWKVLIYFDLAIPIILYLLALLFPILRIRSFFALLFHSYNLYILKTIPDIVSFTGIVGFLYHLGIIGYTLKKRYIKDFILCLLISIVITLIFLTGINYEIIKPLNFA